MKRLKVRDLMTADPTTLKRNDKLTLADDIMRLGRVRHLPVLDDDGQLLVGIVTQRDLFRDALAQALGYGKHAQRKVLDTLTVKDVMATEVVTVIPDASLVYAARVLTERKIGCLPVVENGPGRYPDRGRFRGTSRARPAQCIAAQFAGLSNWRECGAEDR